MNELAHTIEKEARLVILRTLAEQPDGRLNSSLLQAELADRWAINRTRDWLHVQLAFLADVGAISVSDMGSVKIATLRPLGLDHVERRIRIDGVKILSPAEI